MKNRKDIMESIYVRHCNDAWKDFFYEMETGENRLHRDVVEHNKWLDDMSIEEKEGYVYSPYYEGYIKEDKTVEAYGFNCLVHKKDPDFVFSDYYKKAVYKKFAKYCYDDRINSYIDENDEDFVECEDDRQWHLERNTWYNEENYTWYTSEEAYNI